MHTSRYNIIGIIGISIVLGSVVFVSWTYAASTHADQITYPTARTASPKVTPGQIRAAASAVPGGAMLVTSCLPPGPPNPFLGVPGKDGTPCAAVGLGSGMVVTGVCYAGKCRAAGFTPAGSAVGNFLKGIGRDVIKGAAKQFIGNILRGGGGGSGYTGDYNGYTNTSTTTLGDINFNDLGTSTDITGLTFNVPTEPTTHLTPSVPIRRPPPTVVITTPYRPVPAVQQVYKVSASTKGGKVPIPGKTQLQRDLNGGTFYTNSDTPTTPVLSLADLERSAREARLREAQLRAQQATQQQRTYGYRDSNVRGAPLEGATATPTTPKKTWWSTIVSFVGGIFGAR